MPQLELARLADSTRRLVRTVDGLDDQALAAPSLLPGWTRAHVVAHLTLNAEAMDRAVEGVRAGRPEPLYASPERRDAEIDELAVATTPELRERFLGSCAQLAADLESLPPIAWEQDAEWYAGGGPRRPIEAFPDIRRGEVEVHHVDLATDGYGHTDWPGDLAAWILTARSATAQAEPAFTAYAGDLDRRWSFAGGGDDAPVVTGPATELAWWVAGRGPADGLACDGALPRISAW